VAPPAAIDPEFDAQVAVAAHHLIKNGKGGIALHNPVPLFFEYIPPAGSGPVVAHLPPGMFLRMSRQECPVRRNGPRLYGVEIYAVWPESPNNEGNYSDSASHPIFILEDREAGEPIAALTYGKHSNGPYLRNVEM
jgi:hypothetical protein